MIGGLLHTPDYSSIIKYDIIEKNDIRRHQKLYTPVFLIYLYAKSSKDFRLVY